MRDSADLLADSVALSAANGGFMDIHAMVGAMTVQVVGTTAFGWVPVICVHAGPLQDQIL
jgi:hypothetical protein